MRMFDSKKKYAARVEHTDTHKDISNDIQGKKIRLGSDREKLTDDVPIYRRWKRDIEPRITHGPKHRAHLKESYRLGAGKKKIESFCCLWRIRIFGSKRRLKVKFCVTGIVVCPWKRGRKKNWRDCETKVEKRTVINIQERCGSV